MPRTLRHHRPMAALLLAGLALSVSGCSRGAEQADAGAAAAMAQDWSRLKGFTQVDATGPDDVVIRIGDTFSVKAEGDPRTIARLDIQVTGDRLEIGRKSKGGWTWNSDDKGATIRITMPAITAATLTGAGDLDLDRAEGAKLELSLTGAGDVRIGTVKLGALIADITGAGDMAIAGTADEGKLSLTGAGDIDARGLTLGKADVSLLGAGNIDFASDGPVAISIMGPGDVTVKGKAQCTTSGMGPGEARCAP